MCCFVEKQKEIYAGRRLDRSPLGQKQPTVVTVTIGHNLGDVAQAQSLWGVPSPTVCCCGCYHDYFLSFYK